MFATDAMEYGVFPMDFPVPDGFDGPYPTRCGYQSACVPFAVSEGGQGLLVYILRGEGAVSRAGERCGYCAGCMAVAQDAAALTLYPAEETEYLYLLLQNAGSLLAHIASRGFVREVSAGRADRLLGRLCYHASTRSEQEVYGASAQAYALLMELCAVCAPQRTGYSPLVREAIELMREEYPFLTGVEELAGRLGVSASHLIRCFSAAVGVTPGKHLQALKLDNAKLMLQNRDYSIDMVADMTGYAGANYFCKVFRRATGETPGEYRARHLAPPALDGESRRRLEALEQKLHL